MCGVRWLAREDASTGHGTPRAEDPRSDTPALPGERVVVRRLLRDGRVHAEPLTLTGTHSISIE